MMNTHILLENDKTVFIQMLTRGMLYVRIAKHDKIYEKEVSERLSEI